MVELTTLGTMKPKGTVGGCEVNVLIDCGGTCNFISLELVRKLELPTTATTNYGIVMGMGKSVQGKEICKSSSGVTRFDGS